MVFEILRKTAVAYQTPFEFPLFRVEIINEDERIYWKFESRHKVTRIHEKMCETAILTYDDNNANFVRDLITSEDMLFGRGSFDIIVERVFDNALERLIDKIHRC